MTKNEKIKKTINQNKIKKMKKLTKGNHYKICPEKRWCNFRQNSEFS